MGLPEFPLATFPASTPTLRAELRAFLKEAGRDWSPEARARSWMGFDRTFSRAVGARGWIGMTWPRAYGGAERSALERHVVLEEMLAAGAPVGAHWIADRQSGPLLLRLGSEAQRRRYLPDIARGEISFCIGLSELDSGSDLASLRTRARRVPGGWRLDGRKVWTTFAHLCDVMIALVRTSPAKDSEPRHAGLSQVLVDLRAPGVTIRPIRDLEGEETFNEVTFDDVPLPDDALLGREGEGWAGATVELAHERGGPDRVFSSHALLAALLRETAGPQAESVAGRLVARFMVLRHMSASLAARLDERDAGAGAAALVKDLGTAFEASVPEALRQVADPADLPVDVRRMLASVTQVAPTFSLRGGTREIMRGMIARELGLR
jgi:acyl-CoA dehydrogenase